MLTIEHNHYVWYFTFVGQFKLWDEVFAPWQ
jgi:hypothetical protein